MMTSFDRPRANRTPQRSPGQACSKPCLTLRPCLILSVVLLGVSPAFATKTFLDFQVSSTTNPAPSNWNAYTPNDIFAGANIELFDELNTPTGVSFRYDNGSGGFVSYSTTPIYSTYSPSGLDLSEFNESIAIQTIGHRLEFTGLTPGQSYDFWLLGWTYEESFSPPMDFSVSGAGAWTAIDHPSQAYLSINGQYGTTARSFDSYAKSFTADATGALTLESVSGDYFGIYGAVLETTAPTPHKSIGLLPTFDARAEWNGGSFDIVDGDTAISAQNNSAGTTDKRAVMEFDISGIPDDAVITSMSLTLDPWLYSSDSINGGPRLPVYGYGGNGLPNDYDAENTAFLLGESDEVTDTSPFEIALDPTLLQLMLPNSDYLGLVVHGSEHHQQLSFGSIENTFSAPPTLSIEYSILPEGDLDGDGFVGLSDLDILLANWNETVPPINDYADPSGDGFVGLDDLDILLNNWNAGIPPVNNAVPTIPEPGTLTALGCLAAVFGTRRRCA